MHPFHKGNPLERRCHTDMTSFMLIWILLQKIEKLEEELNTYKTGTNKN